MLFRRWLAILLPLLLVGCRAPQPVTSSKGSTAKDVIKDDLGREIPLRGEAQRVVIIGPGAIETVYALKAEAKLVGRDSYADYPAAAKNIAVAGDYSGPAVEKCIALRPDLVILQGETWDRGRVENWQKQIGVPVAALTATNLKAVQENFRKLGIWLGRREAADYLAKTLDIAPSKRKVQVTAFVEVGRSPLYTAGQGTLVSDVLEAGGFTNVAADVRGYQPFGQETLLARQPAVYVAPSKSSQQVVLKELRASPTLSKLNCVRDGRVISIQGDYLLRPCPRLRLGIEQLKKEAQRLKSSAPLR